jgi:hypothetical protein
MECCSINVSSRIYHGMLGSLGNDQHGWTNFDCILLGFRIPCAFQLFNFVVGTMLAQNINGKSDQLIIYT